MKNDMHVLVSGASLAGLSTAYWMNRSGCKVTVVEIANGLRRGGTAVNVSGPAVDVAKRMGILEEIRSNRLNLELWEFKNADDVTERTLSLKKEGEARSDDDFEIERTNLLDILFDTIKSDVEFIFDNSITVLGETDDDIEVSFRNGSQRSFDLVFGCDGTHSVVRKIWFGPETEYSHFLEQYSAITIVDKLLIKQNTAQMYNAPGKFVMLNAYKNKTDIILGFASETEIPYDYRNEEQQRTIVEEQFAGRGWRTAELLDEVRQCKRLVNRPAWPRA
jgi:2-polyprenyl-6-methoxyphenol hydroxylase-like FAD-dependent oxidoreductase